MLLGNIDGQIRLKGLWQARSLNGCLQAASILLESCMGMQEVAVLQCFKIVSLKERAKEVEL